jgi:hypothetical protein
MENKKEDFYDKVKRFAEKTEDFIDEQVEKLKKNGTLDKITEYADKTEDFIEKKVEQFKNSDIPDKVDEFVEKTEKKASEVIKKAGEVGDKVSEKIEDFVDGIQHRAKKNKSNPKESKDSDQLKPVE